VSDSSREQASAEVLEPAIGVDVGGTKLLAVLIEPGGRVTTDPLHPSPATGLDLVGEVMGSVERLAGGAVASVGVGVPGRVDGRDVVQFAPNLKGIVGSGVGAELRAALPQTRVWVGNDAGAACWAEHELGAGRGTSDMVMITLGTGIGGGVVADGHLLEGSSRFAGEIGHMVVDPAGPPCPCGQRGCWERYASGNGLGDLARGLARAGEMPTVVELAGGDASAVRGEHVTTAAANGDRAALQVVKTFSDWVALGLANLANILDPGVMVIGGGLVTVGDLFMDQVRVAFAERLVGHGSRVPPRVVTAELGPSAGAVGAALLGALAGGA
jgi:glucokinase